MHTQIKTEHTPGPWTHYNITTAKIGIMAGQDSVALVYRMQGSPCLMDRAHEGEANARLIAAAPDLLAACKGALACLQSGDLTPNMAVKRIRAAIARATGETNHA